MQGLAALHGRAALAPLEESAGIVVQARGGGVISFRGDTGGGAAGLGEEVRGVAGPAAREVDALGAVVVIIRALHEHHLIAVVELRNTAEGGQQRQGQLHPGRIPAEDVPGAGVVVVGEENQQVIQIRIDKILGQDGIDAGHALVPEDFVLAEGRKQGVLQREVHNAGQIAVEAAGVGMVLLPEGHLRDVEVPALPYDVQVRILVRERLAPLGHGSGLVVGIGVHAQAVQAGVLHPPDGPLLEVLQHKGIVQVHVGHRRNEPAAFLPVAVLHRGMGIHVHGEEGVHLHVGLGHVVPVGERRVVHPPVRGAAVVGDDVHHHFQAAGMGFVDKTLVEGIVTETGVDVIVVRAGIAVVGLVRLIVQQQRCGPDGRGTQIGHIIQMVDHALEVSAVPRHGVFAVHFVGGLRGGPGMAGTVFIGLSGPAGVVIGRTRGEAVRDDEVHHVGGGITRAVGASRLARPEEVGVLHRLLSPVNYQVVSTSLGRGGDVDVDKEIIRAVGLVDGLHLHAAAAFNPYVLCADAGALHHQLQGHFHAGPPAEGLYTGDFRGRGVRHGGGVEGGLTSGHRKQERSGPEGLFQE